MASTLQAEKQRVAAPGSSSPARFLVPVVQHRVDRIGVADGGAYLDKLAGGDAMRRQPCR
jgi:hypothetical protein